MLQQLMLFQPLGEEPLQILCDKARLAKLPSGSAIYRHGEPAYGFYALLDGWVKLYRHTPDGQELVPFVCSKNDCFFEADIFSEKKVHTLNAQVIEEAVVAEFPAEIIRELTRTNGEFALRILSGVSRQLNTIGTRAEHLITMSSAQRVGCYLLELMAGQQVNNGQLTLPYHKSIVAAKLGMEQETLSRSFKKLKEKGVTVEGRQIEIKDMQALKQFCCEHCSDFEICRACSKP